MERIDCVPLHGFTDDGGRVALGGLFLLALAVAFGLSGLSALVYQVAWQRILLLSSGASAYSVALITAAFMAGLGFGSYAGGVASARVTPGTALRLFAGLELGVAVFAAASGFLYYDWLYLQAGGFDARSWRAGLLHFLALLPPTGMMGMSLPFLVRALVRDVPSAARTVSLLYGINVLGASLGALLAPWLLMPRFGVRGALLAGALGNVLAAAAALAASWGKQKQAIEAAQPAGEAMGGGSVHGLRFGSWMALYATTGFCALGLEMLWFRIIDVGAKSTAFTFGTVLAVYLAGVALGSLAGEPLARRVRDPLRVFLICQCALVAAAALAMLLMVRLPADLPFYEWFVSYWEAHKGFRLGTSRNREDLLRLYVFWPVALFGLPTMLMGLSFCVLQRAVHDDARTSGLKVGLLQAANIGGCIAGSLAVGLVALDRLGTAGTLRLFLFIGIGLAALGARRYGSKSAFSPLAGALAALLLASPGQDRLWWRLHGQTQGPPFVEEDATGVVVMTPRRGEWWMRVNGRGHGVTPFGGVHTLLGALPTLMHAAPADALIVGLGAGDTAWAAACREGVRRVRVFEIVAGEERLLRRFARTENPLHLRGFLRDRRIEVRVADGRNALLREDARYDVIEADPLFPESAGSGNLYSVEFFRLAASRLRPGGLMSTWAPTPRVSAGFCQAFPHVVEFLDGQLLVGSRDPIRLETEAWSARALLPAIRAYLGPANTGEVFRQLSTARLADPARFAGILPNEDLFPRDEFAVPW